MDIELENYYKDLEKIKDIDNDLKILQIEFKSLITKSAELEFAEHNINKAIKWIERHKNGNGNISNISK